MAIRLIKESKKLKEGKLREFTKTDYYTYSEAEKLPSGKEPLTASGEYGDIVVSGDDENANVQIFIGDGENDKAYETVDKELSEKDAIEIGEKLAKYLDSSIENLTMVAKKLGLKHMFDM